MLLKAIYDYLTDQGTVSPTAFETAAVVYGMTLSSRDDARRELINRVGKNLFWWHTPSDVSGHSWIVLKNLSDSAESSTLGGYALRESTVQIDCYCVGHQAAWRSQVCATLLELACHGFHGAKWGEVFIASAEVVNTSGGIIDAPENVKKPIFVNSVDLQVKSNQPSTGY